ncbi:10922_t:CDS:2, partial [Funneliformis mosseae]
RLSNRQTLISRNVVFSRYLVQRGSTHYGRQDPALTEMKLKYNVIPSETNKVRLDQKKKIRNPWASGLPLSVFSIILQEGEARFSKILPIKGNDMELFHFISAGTSQELKNNYDTIKNLILKNNFVPFPLWWIFFRNHQIVHYYSIPTSGWLWPIADDVKFRLTKLIELGFKLDDNKSIADALQIFEISWIFTAISKSKCVFHEQIHGSEIASICFVDILSTGCRSPASYITSANIKFHVKYN